MNTSWKWDWKHGVILLAFFSGLAWTILSTLVPLIQSGQFTVVSALPVVLMSLSTVGAFFKNPPNSPEQALQEGEGGAGGIAGKRGFAELRLMALLSLIGLCLLASHLLGCISVTPTVPQTPDNTAKIASCESTATLHNGFVMGGIGIGGASAIAAGIAAASPDNKGLQQGTAITAAAAAGLAAIATGGAGLTAASFTNNRCTDVTTPLPMQKNPSGKLVVLPAFSNM